MDDVSEREAVRSKIDAAIKITEYKYFGDYEFSDEQHEAVETLVEVARTKIMTDDAVRDALKAAYIAGAEAVHKYWTENPGEAPRGDPEFGESASDYAADAIERLEHRKDGGNG